MDNRALMAIAGGVVLGLVAWKVAGAVGSFADKLAGVGGQAVDMADKVVSTPVLAAGDVLGIPRTNLTECEKAKREGRTWDASFACPAGDFLGYVFG